jgi:putative membrane-bound dehydrogenase-like protein
MNRPAALRAVLLSFISLISYAALAVEPAPTAQPPLDLRVPPGFSVELVAGSPLTERPIVASFDDDGRLYVAESSGSNDPVEKQLAERPHRIVRLEDTDSDGRFDRRIVFADRMMFPEGAQWLDGSLYVSAPPSIWKLTDSNGDGIADERIEWFQGKTLTGCANDLHGPYAGPDGWLYWCKGAFAEQTHVVRGKEWTTRAAHIFRCRPDGSCFEPVMTGGMDNPVDVTFTPEGERILTSTYLAGSGRVDGIVHAIYGGAYGKEHGVLDGHPRTGELMPALVAMSPAAPCGLERYNAEQFGTEYQGNLFACQFNLRKVSRHVLSPRGSSFESEDSDFVTCDNVDFHPTDVLVDADGSLLVIDTGGWYKLCCPTSQLWKPDVLGGIYRVRRTNTEAPTDPRGRKIDWQNVTVEALWDLHCDRRPAVRQRAAREFVRRCNSSEIGAFVTALGAREINVAIRSVPEKNADEFCNEHTAAIARTWTLGQIETLESKECVRQLLTNRDESIRHAAVNLVSLHRDELAYPQLLELLQGETPAVRRAAAEAIGRLGKVEFVPHLLQAATGVDDRIMHHSITYALIELGDSAAIRSQLASIESHSRAAALIALDQMPGSHVEPGQVIPSLDSNDRTLREASRWLVARHPEWGDQLSEWFRQELAALTPTTDVGDDRQASELERLLVRFSVHPSIQDLLATTIADKSTSITTSQTVLAVMTKARFPNPPAAWREALVAVLDDANDRLVPMAVAAASSLPAAPSADDPLNRALAAVANAPESPQEIRVFALAAIAASRPELNDIQFNLLLDALAAENSVPVRSAAADALNEAPLNSAQLKRLCTAIETSSPLEINQLVRAFSRATDDAIARQLLESLQRAAALPSVRVDGLRIALEKRGAEVQRAIDALERQVNVNATAQRARIEELLPQMASGDVRRGHAVFQSSKAACAACHRMGHAGGTVGPELSRIGEARTERDLLESILYPSLSFVRSYEPVSLITADGRTINGTIRDENEHEYLLATGPDQEVRIPREEVESIEPSNVSIMPGGLEGQLTTQELADLVAFLKNAAGK